MIVPTSVKAGGTKYQHGQAVVVRTGTRAGGIRMQNHAQAAVVVKTSIKAGGYSLNHSATLACPAAERKEKKRCNS